MKKLILILLLFVGALDTFAQQDPQYSLYMFNPLAVNPGYAGSREVMSAVLVHRSQWVGLDGAPETQAFSLNTPLKNKKMGIGLQVVNDKIGPKNTLNIDATYAYRIRLGKGKLAFGLGVGMISYNFNWDKIEYIDDEDAIPETSAESFVVPNIDFGLYYNTRTFYIGAAVDHLNGAQFKLNPIDTVDTEARVYGSLIVTVGKAFVLNDNLVMKTSLLTRGANNFGNIDLNVGLLMKNKIFVGITLRTTSTLVLMTEVNISKNLRMGIAYDWDGTEVAKSSSGSFEVFLGYDIAMFKSKVLSPRYF